RAEASSDWLMGKLYEQGLHPQAGNVSVNADGSSVSFSNVIPAEDFRLPIRTIINPMWHGAPVNTWNPVTHEVQPGTNQYELNNARRLAEFVKNPPNACEKPGMDPVQGITFDGPSLLRSCYTTAGAAMDNFYLQWTPAAAAGA